MGLESQVSSNYNSKYGKCGKEAASGVAEAPDFGQGKYNGDVITSMLDLKMDWNSEINQHIFHSNTRLYCVAIYLPTYFNSFYNSDMPL